eukprot:3060876-Rhodomonas_salina.1
MTQTLDVLDSLSSMHLGMCSQRSPLPRKCSCNKQGSFTSLSVGFQLPNEKVEAIALLQETTTFQEFQAPSSQRQETTYKSPAIDFTMNRRQLSDVVNAGRPSYSPNSPNAPNSPNSLTCQERQLELVILILTSWIVTHWNLRNQQYFWSACFVLLFTGVALERNSEAAFMRRIGMKSTRQSVSHYLSNFIVDVQKSTGGNLTIWGGVYPMGSQFWIHLSCGRTPNVLKMKLRQLTSCREYKGRTGELKHYYSGGVLPGCLFGGDDNTIRDKVSYQCGAVWPYLVHPFGDVYLHCWWQRALTLQRVPKVQNERPSDFVMHRVLRTCPMCHRDCGTRWRPWGSKSCVLEAGPGSRVPGWSCPAAQLRGSRVRCPRED